MLYLGASSLQSSDDEEPPMKEEVLNPPDPTFWERGTLVTFVSFPHSGPIADIQALPLTFKSRLIIYRKGIRSLCDSVENIDNLRRTIPHEGIFVLCPVRTRTNSPATDHLENLANCSVIAVPSCIQQSINVERAR